MPKSDFLWTFPCFILATNHNTNPTTGAVKFDEDFRFIAPELIAGEKQIAIFTDAAVAEEFAEQSQSADADLVEFATPAALKEFLIVAARTFKHAAIDPNRKTRISRLFMIDEILAQIDGWFDQSGGFDH
jgi:hypothetical protein